MFRQFRFQSLTRACQIALALGLTLAIVTAPGTSQATLPPPGLADLVETLMPGVVSITSKTLVSPDTSAMTAAGNLPGGMNTPEPTSHTQVGSGFVVDPDGIIVSNNHVIDGAYDITATFHDGTVAKAEVIATTTIGDIALLRVNLSHKLTALKFGDSTRLRVGDPVVAIGNPLGFGGTVSTGIVSALNRNIMLSPFDDFIQTDASLNHGNSGGPLFNLQGEVIGVNTALYTPNPNGGSIGIGFAIPSYCASFVVGQLTRFGHVKAGEIGVKLQDVTAEIAHAVSLPVDPDQAAHGTAPVAYGVIVTDVPQGSSARDAGIQQGDVIRRVNGETVPDIRAFAREVAVKPLGQKVTLALWRDGAEQVVQPVVREWISGAQVDLAALERTQSRRAQTMDLGLQLAALSPEDRAARDLPPDSPGVLVSSVAPFSIASDRGLGVGDVILKVQTRPVSRPEDVLTSLIGMWQEKRSIVMLLVDGKQGLRWVPVPMVHGAIPDKKG
jgi:serine protease Do